MGLQLKRYRLFLWVVLFHSGAGDASALEFSSETVTSSRGVSFDGKVYVSGNKVRMESGADVNIVRGDKGVTWALMPGRRMYLERPVDARMIAGTSETMPGEIEREFLGNDTVNGRKVARYRVVYDDNGMSRALELWLDPVSSLPFRVRAEDGGWTVEYRNAVTWPEDTALFELPQGYSRYKEKSY
ncbi:MAG: hypothetical protein HQL30_03780 [Candidatus Omnitrophica bacterium]|nr:hypothetical protein [Candidatus Omnitrophota bacterium]